MVSIANNNWQYKYVVGRMVYVRKIEQKNSVNEE